jgi:hypothetical protein
MPLVVPDEGERRLLEIIVGKSTLAAGELILHLYVNQVDLSNESFTVSSFTEASASGYSAITLEGANWTADTQAGVSAIVYDSNVTFTFNVGQDVYGYYVTNNSNQILWAEEFPGAPFALPSTGGEISIRPQVQLN